MARSSIQFRMVTPRWRIEVAVLACRIAGVLYDIGARDTAIAVARWACALVTRGTRLER